MLVHIQVMNGWVRVYLCVQGGLTCLCLCLCVQVLADAQLVGRLVEGLYLSEAKNTHSL